MARDEVHSAKCCTDIIKYNNKPKKQGCQGCQLAGRHATGMQQSSSILAFRNAFLLFLKCLLTPRFPLFKNTVIKSEQMDSSAVWASDKGPCSVALNGAAAQNPVEHGTGGTPQIGEEHMSCIQTSENLEGLTEKVDTLDL
jgi:hypothetical protein